MTKHVILLTLLLGSMLNLSAQQTTIFTDAQLQYKKGLALYENDQCGPAQRVMRQVLDEIDMVHEPAFEMLRMNAELVAAKSAIKLEQIDAEKLILDFIRRYYPDPTTVDALIEIGNFYFDQKKYKESIEYFSRLVPGDLNLLQLSEIKFKMGYAYFVRKKFDEAMINFKQIKDIQNEYYYPTNYYYGMVTFFKSDYQETIRTFNKVEQSPVYRPYVPYYLAQIYLAQKDYDKLVSYAEPKLQLADLKKRNDLHRILGQAYFEQNDYAKALTYLEKYAEGSKKMRKEDFYQLGYVYYKNGNYAKAIDNFDQLVSLKDETGQSAMYYLGDSYVKTGDKAKARVAFGKASQATYNKEIGEEANYNYAKLSYELGYDRDAINALMKIPSSSENYNEGQTIMSYIFLNTRDYAKAVDILEDISNPTTTMKTTYQKVSYYRGLQQMEEGNNGGAKSSLRKSLQIKNDKDITALTHFWLGEIAFQENMIDQSNKELTTFKSTAGNANQYPEISSIHTANYMMGYNAMRKNDYRSGLKYFNGAISSIEQNNRFLQSEYIKKTVLQDAVVRAGDCEFKNKSYDNAIRFYSKAINGRYAGAPYALFQKATLLGLQNKYVDQILALEDIINDYPKSEYVDDALLESASTYQDMGQGSKALTPLRTLVSDYKGKSKLVNRAYLQLGLISYNQGDLRDAIKHYKAVLYNNPTPPETEGALAALKEIYIVDLNQPDEYVAIAEDVPGYDLNTSEKDKINYNAAVTQYENGKYEEAIKAFTTYLRKYPNGQYKLGAYYNRAEAYAIQEQYASAFKDYEVVIQAGQSQHYNNALYKAATIAYNANEDFYKAYDYYKKLAEVADSEERRFEGQVGALRSAYRTNNKAGVFAMADQVSQNARASKNDQASAYFYVGKILYEEGQYPTALRSLNSVTKLSNNEQTAEARYLISEIYYKQGEVDIAEQLCINSNKESSNYPYWVAKSVLLLSDIFVLKDDLLNARAALEALLANYSDDQTITAEAQAKLNKVNAMSEKDNRLMKEPSNPNVLELEEGGLR